MMRGVLRLVRASSFATAPSDVLAGCFLATPVSDAPPSLPLVALCGSALLLYWGGLALNDLRDLEDDRVLRPDRPLPSGDLAPGIARGIVIASHGIALALAASVGARPAAVAGALAALSFAYNLGAKRWRFGGPAVMGGCRLLSFGLGVSAAERVTGDALLHLAPVFGFYFVFVAAITWVARAEAGSEVRPSDAAAVWVCAAVPATLAILAGPLDLGPLPLAGAAPLALLSVVLGAGGFALLRTPTPVGVRGWVRDAVLGILLWNGGLILVAGSLVVGIPVALLFFLSKPLARILAPS